MEEQCVCVCVCVFFSRRYLLEKGTRRKIVIFFFFDLLIDTRLLFCQLEYYIMFGEKIWIQAFFWGIITK